MADDNYYNALSDLNDGQREAVEQIDGPVLVIAGPGTGKTQLLSTRVAKILQETDTAPQNILCLTFTENGARAMSDRLIGLIGPTGQEVTIGTYHSFGSDLISRYSDYFLDKRLNYPIDDLEKDRVFRQIVEEMPFNSPFKYLRDGARSVFKQVSEIKQSLLSSSDLINIAENNDREINKINPLIEEIMQGLQRMPSSFKAAQPLYQKLLSALQSVSTNSLNLRQIDNLIRLAENELVLALNKAEEVNKSTPLTAWKNNWLRKDNNDRFIFNHKNSSLNLKWMANLFEMYNKYLLDHELYDFDDMILRVVDALQNNLDFKYTIQEQYQYIMLDEFQDTNVAQLKLIELLTDNPVHEGRPNVLAVGDDDQAIFSFQGANYSNMIDFSSMYKSTKVINLVENYRSRAEIIDTFEAVAGQIDDRVSFDSAKISKQLIPANQKLPSVVIDRKSFVSDAAEFVAISSKIKELIDSGISASQIAVIAPQHRYLKGLLPYLSEGISVRYEKSSDILKSPLIRYINTTLMLIQALSQNDFKKADSYWPEVLSHDAWNLPVDRIWQFSWRAGEEKRPWLNLLLEDKLFRPIALIISTMASQANNLPVEEVIDAIIGSISVNAHDDELTDLHSPIRAWLLDSNPALLYDYVSDLKILFTSLKDRRRSNVGGEIFLSEYLQLIDDYKVAGLEILNSNPYSEAENAIQLMTVYKAKGLEFDHVFLLHCQDDIWGNSTRSGSGGISLPPNIAPIRFSAGGKTEDERLRIFFVALSRAKYGLHIYSHNSKYDGKKTLPLRFLLEHSNLDGYVVDDILPNEHNLVIFDNQERPTIDQIDLLWSDRHRPSGASVEQLLKPRLANFRLSPTSLTGFLDIQYGGPEIFYLKNILWFPEAPSADSIFGTLIHDSLQFVQNELNAKHEKPEIATVVNYFKKRLLDYGLPPAKVQEFSERGEFALSSYLNDNLKGYLIGDIAEHNFRSENLLLKGTVPLSGKIDLIRINEPEKQINVIDYKTGSLGGNRLKLHKYETQLYGYKILLNSSKRFKDYNVNSGELIFIEPDKNNEIIHHKIGFDDKRLKRTEDLMLAMWQHVMSLDFPNIDSYKKTLSGIINFEDDLLNYEK